MKIPKFSWRKAWIEKAVDIEGRSEYIAWITDYYCWGLFKDSSWISKYGGTFSLINPHNCSLTHFTTEEGARKAIKAYTTRSQRIEV